MLHLSADDFTHHAQTLSSTDRRVTDFSIIAQEIRYRGRLG
jgi:hypothetical protein